MLLTKNWKLNQVFGTSITEPIQIALLDGCKSSQKLDCIRLRQVEIKRCKHIHFTAQYIIRLICTITKICKIINGWPKNIILVYPTNFDVLIRDQGKAGFGSWTPGLKFTKEFTYGYISSYFAAMKSAVTPTFWISCFGTGVSHRSKYRSKSPTAK